MRFRYGLGWWLGFTCGTLVATLLVIAVDTTANQWRFRIAGVLMLIGFLALVGGVLGVILAQAHTNEG